MGSLYSYHLTEALLIGVEEGHYKGGSPRKESVMKVYKVERATDHAGCWTRWYIPEEAIHLTRLRLMAIRVSWWRFVLTNRTELPPF